MIKVSAFEGCGNMQSGLVRAIVNGFVRAIALSMTISLGIDRPMNMVIRVVVRAISHEHSLAQFAVKPLAELMVLPAGYRVVLETRRF